MMSIAPLLLSAKAFARARSVLTVAVLAASGVMPSLSVAQTAPSTPSTPTAPRWVEAFVGTESLSNGYASWQTMGLTLRQQASGRDQWQVGLRQVRRFDQTDTELAGEITKPLNEVWTGAAGVAVSADSPLLPRSKVYVALARGFSDGWAAGAQLSRRDHNPTVVIQADLTVERYWDANWRTALTLSRARTDGVWAGHGARVQIDYSFDEQRRIGLTLAKGVEYDSGLATGATTGSMQDVQAVVVTAQWPLSNTLSLRGELGTHRQDSSYRRTGGTLGVQYRF